MNVQGPVPSLPRSAPAVRPASARPAPAAAPASAAGAPAAPPEAGFWDLLTPEERDFFAQQSALGPLTYGPRRDRTSPPQGPLGQRVDVRG